MAPFIVVLAEAVLRPCVLLTNPQHPLLLFQGLRFEVVPSRFKETLDKASFATPYAYAIETAVQKALEVTRRIHQARGPLLLELCDDAGFRVSVGRLQIKAISDVPFM